MPAPLSIVIPALKPTAELGLVVAALFEGLERGLIKELIISGSEDNALEEMAVELGAVMVTGPTGRGGQLKRGAQAATGRWLLFLHSDTTLAQGWSDTVVDHITNTPDCAGYFRLKFRVSGIRPALVAFWTGLRCRIFGLPFGDQGLLISRHLYDQIGGYQDIPLMEDVAIARSLRGQLKALPAQAITSAEKYQRNGYLRQSLSNFSLLMRYFWGVDPAKLAEIYREKT